MWKWLKELDRVLRGEATRLEDLREGTIPIPAHGLSAVLLALAMLYGMCMGCFALFRADGPVFAQLVATTVKVPALFFLTLVVTFPSLYVFNALVGSRLNLPAIFRLLIASLGVNLAVLSSLGPIVAFFALSTTSYSFMVLLNVLVFALAGLLGLAFLLQTLHRLTVAQWQPEPWTPPAPPPMPSPPAAAPGGGDLPGPAVSAEVVPEPGPLERLEGHFLGRHVKTVFTCWVVLFGLVGAQMGWVLRPFIGDPGREFQWFRARESNFFEAVWHALGSLFF